MIDTVTSILNIIPVEAWQALIIGLVSSPAAIPLIKWFGIPAHRDGLKAAVVMVLAMLGTFITYMNTHSSIVANHKTVAIGLVIAQGLVAFSVSQATFYAAIRPLRGKFSVAYKNAAELNAAKSSAKLPQSGEIFSN